MKAIIFDSGTLINLSMNGFLYLLKDLKDSFGGKFLITRDVKYETVDRPSGILRFELGALRVSKLIDEGVLEMPSSVGVSNEGLEKETKKFMNIANNSVLAGGVPIRIVSDAEMSCVALSSELSKAGVENLISIDERTTRILSEKPENLEKIMSNKLHQRVEIKYGELKAFSKFRFIRSSEIIYIAFKKGLLGIEGKKALEASLFATKFHGAAISFEEIDILKKM